jgi:tRNA pseudouridine55 synthase
MHNFEAGEVLLFDKPLTWTSFNVVGKVKFVLKKYLGLKKIKVGHAGTLDPLATGLLIVCTGKKTKEIESYQASEKEYIADIYLGKTTPSFDLETEVDAEYETNHITSDYVCEKLKMFIGEISQIPPVFSAKMINGRRAYSYARSGEEVEMKAVKVTIKELEVLKFELPVLQVRIVCSKGTYIRSLARDIGIELNSGAHLVALRRTKSGYFNVNEAMHPNDFEQKILHAQVQMA